MWPTRQVEDMTRGDSTIERTVATLETPLPGELERHPDYGDPGKGIVIVPGYKGVIQSAGRTVPSFYPQPTSPNPSHLLREGVDCCYERDGC